LFAQRGGTKARARISNRGRGIMWDANVSEAMSWLGERLQKVIWH
jgi:hypothetical protein